MYYLQSRYYDPEVGRFINGDEHIGINSDILRYNLYAYCSNNPVTSTDPSGEFSLTGPYTVMRGLVYYMYPAHARMSAKQINNNYNRNVKFRFDGYINDQNSGNASRIRMGYYNGSYNGCGWIATYNAIRMTGYWVHPCHIVKHYELWGSILSGTFGIFPDAIRDFFKRGPVKDFYKARGYKVKTTWMKTKGIDKNAKNARANILCYSHSEGMHYISFKWDGTKFIIYNGHEKTVTSIERHLKDNKFKAMMHITIG